MDEELTPHHEDPPTAHDQGADGRPRDGGTPVVDRANRVHWFAGRLGEVLDELTAGGVRVAELSAEETAEAIGELTVALGRLDALRCHLLTHAEVVDVAGHATPAATSTGAWLAHTTVTPVGAAFGLVRLSRRLAHHDQTRTALEAGVVDLAQAKVITEALDALPASVTAADRTRAETHLLDQGRHHDAKKLKLLAKHLLAVIDPDAAEAALAKQVAAEEARAAAKTMLSMYDDGNGTCHGTFQISSLHGAMLRTALDALVSPRRPDPIPREVLDAEGTLTPLSTAELDGIAFGELLERYPARRLPRTGGGLATIIVSIDHHQLTGQVAAASLDTGGHLSPGQLRRLACNAGIISQVLGAGSELLDQSRMARFFNTAQTIAMRIRDKTCTALGCAIPAAWCHAHHKDPWSKGGKTTLDNGRMLCARHHTMIHHPAYTHTDLPDGKVQITKTRRRH